MEGGRLIMKRKVKRKKPRLTTTKKLILFLFINCTVIELFVFVITFISVLQVRDTLTTPDFTPLTTLVSAVVGEVIGFGIYAAKSAKENSAGGLIYEQAMKEEEFDEVVG